MSITAILLNPLGPALILGAGGLLIALSRWVIPDPLLLSGAAGFSQPTDSFGRSRLRPLLRALFALAVAVAALLLLLLRHRPGDASLTWTWQPLTVAGGALLWVLDGWNWLASVLILVLTVTMLAMSEFGEDLALTRSWSGREAERGLWLGAAALCFVCSGNVVTMASGWVLLDLMLAARLRPGTSEEPAGRAWSLVSLTGILLLAALMVLGEPNVRATLGGEAFTPAAFVLLWLTALVRAGVYPLHFWLTGPGRTDAGGRVALHLVGPLTGLWLLARLNQAADPAWLSRPEWAALGALALLGTAIVAWTVEDDHLRWRWVALNRASLVVLAVYMVASVGAQAQVWLLITFAIGGGLLAVGLAMWSRWRWRWALVLAALAVWGVPGTPGFLARWTLVFPTNLPFAAPLFALIVISEALLVAALWQLAVARRNRDDSLAALAGVSLKTGTGFRRLLGLELGLACGLLVVALFYWGLSPDRLATLLRFPESGAFSPMLSSLANSRRSVWIGFVLAGAGGLALGLLRNRIFAQMRGWQSSIVTVVSLEWLYRGVLGALALAGSVLKYFAELGEGEGYLGWLLLAGAILWLLLRG